MNNVKSQSNGKQKLGRDYLLANYQPMVQSYIRLGFGCKIIDPEGIEWGYKDIAEYNGTKLLSFADFCDWCMMRFTGPQQMRMVFGDE